MKREEKEIEYDDQKRKRRKRRTNPPTYSLTHSLT